MTDSKPAAEHEQEPGKTPDIQHVIDPSREDTQLGDEEELYSAFLRIIAIGIIIALAGMALMRLFGEELRTKSDVNVWKWEYHANL